MKIDYDLQMHYNGTGYIKPDGYILRFLNDKICNDISSKFNLKLVPKEHYKTIDSVLFKSIYNYLGDKKCYVGLYGEDSWSLYMLENKEYWDHLYGEEGYVEKRFPLYGINLWNSIKDLEYNNE